MPAHERVVTGERLARKLRVDRTWLFCIAVGFVCTAYFNVRTRLVPKIGEWYPSDSHPAVMLQLRAWFSGRLAPVSHPSGGWYDYMWGRGGMHSSWGLGVPILAIPFHAVARLFGAPDFPDHARFLVLHAITVVLLARALYVSSGKEPSSLVASGAAAGFFLLSPTFVGLVAARFANYDQAIAVAALWSVVLLTGILALVERSTVPRLTVVCAAAAFAPFFRATMAAYGLTTVALALAIAHRRGIGRRGLIAGAGAAAAVAALYLLGNEIRFGSPFEAGYANLASERFVNRLTRWGVSFAMQPWHSAARELYATLFRLEPLGSDVIANTPASVPASIAPYALGERWREYYSPTFDLWVLAAWIATFGVVAWRLVQGAAWRGDHDAAKERATIVGLWALPPSIVLFAFYAKLGNLATRYCVDFYPAYAACFLCVGIAVVDAVRRRAPARVPAAQLAIAVLGAFYLPVPHGWAFRLSPHASTRKQIEERLARIDGAETPPPTLQSHLACDQPHRPGVAYGDLAGWRGDGAFPSGMVFTMPPSPCIAFTFGPGGSAWTPPDEESLTGFRASADFDVLRRCRAATTDGATRTITMCEPHAPRFLLDGMRLYSVASLDASLDPIDRLKLLRIDAASTCP
jgi:hypothetical protein